jgi:hypothetical protein
MRLFLALLTTSFVVSSASQADDFVTQMKCWPRSAVTYVGGEFKIERPWVTLEIGKVGMQRTARIVRFFGLAEQRVALTRKRGVLKNTYTGEGLKLVVRKFTIDREFPAPVSKLQADLAILPEVTPDMIVDVVCSGS